MRGTLSMYMVYSREDEIGVKLGGDQEKWS